jgi:hypothetical protein
LDWLLVRFGGFGAPGLVCNHFFLHWTHLWMHCSKGVLKYEGSISSMVCHTFGKSVNR